MHIALPNESLVQAYSSRAGHWNSQGCFATTMPQQAPLGIGFLVITSQKLGLAKVRVISRTKSILFYGLDLFMALLPRARTYKLAEREWLLTFLPQMPLLPHPSPSPIITPLLPFPSSSSKCVLVGHQGQISNTSLEAFCTCMQKTQSSSSFRKSAKQVVYLSKKIQNVVTLALQLVVGPLKK